MDPFEAIYRDHAPGIYGFLYKMSRDAHLSEELMQETFLQAWRCRARYNGSCDLFTWLCAIAKNLYFAKLRKDKHLLFHDDLLEEEIDQTPAPEERLIRAERAKAVRDAIAHLPGNYRDVVLLRIYAELPFSHIARYLSISEGSAKVIFYRAKAKLKEELAHVCL